MNSELSRLIAAGSNVVQRQLFESAVAEPPAPPIGTLVSVCYDANLSLADNQTDLREGLIRGKPVAVFPIGKTIAIDGRVIVMTTAQAQLMVDDANARKYETPVTYMHEKDPARGGEIAGYLSNFTVRDGHVYADEVWWTQDAADGITAKKFRYQSPDAWGDDKRDGFHPDKLRCLSLVPIRALHEMPPVTMNAQTVEASGSSAVVPPTSSPAQASQKGKEFKGMDADMMELLGLAADASEEQVMKAKSRLKAKMAKMAAEPDGDECPPGKKMAAAPAGVTPEQVASIVAETLASHEKGRETRLAAERQASDKIKSLLDGAQKDYRITKAERGKYEAIGTKNGADVLETVLSAMEPKKPLAFAAPDTETSEEEAAEEIPMPEFGTMMVQLAAYRGIGLQEASEELHARGFKAAAYQPVYNSEGRA